MTNVKRELEAIRLSNGGLLTEEAVLAAAKAKGHPLHGRFTWDDTDAAKQWRLEEARLLIRSVFVTIETPRHEAVSVRAYASLPSDRETGGGYRSIDSIMRDQTLRRELFVAALSELDAFKKRYANLSRLTPVFDAIEAVKAKRVFEKSRSPKPKKRAMREARL